MSIDAIVLQELTRIWIEDALKLPFDHDGNLVRATVLKHVKDLERVAHQWAKQKEHVA